MQADLSHELLGGEDQLVVDEPAGLLLEQRAVWVDINRLLVLHRLVAAFAQSRRVVEISCSHRLGEEEESEGEGFINSWFITKKSGNQGDHSSIIQKQNIKNKEHDTCKGALMLGPVAPYCPKA